MTPPLENIKFWAGAGLVALALSSSHLLDGPSEIEAAQATEANRLDALNDALAAAQAERPELWSDEQKARARVAAALVAREVQP
jgi:hypothetical protein